MSFKVEAILDLDRRKYHIGESDDVFCLCIDTVPVLSVADGHIEWQVERR